MEDTYNNIIKELQYPFEAYDILRCAKKWKKVLLQQAESYTKKKIAILGGSTTHHIKDVAELFLMSVGILPEFYESDYGTYWEEGLFENHKLKEFQPDIIYIFTTYRNILEQNISMEPVANVEKKIDEQYNKFYQLWENLRKEYSCTIIQNNFEQPFFRILGNQEAVLPQGQIYFVNHLNEKFYQYANVTKNFYILDIQYLAADYGLSRWHDLNAWYMYKYAFALEAIPMVAFNLTNIIKSIAGRNKKALVLDLDNTLWGGTISEDGEENIEIGNGTPVGEAYLEFQKYLKKLADIGVVLSICSKNDENIAEKGLSHPDNYLRKEDFYSIQANWNRKDENIEKIAKEINIFTDSLVFVDDNPAEREIVEQNLPMVAVPDIGLVENYIKVIDKAGYFEVLSLSEEDAKRNKMYKENKDRLNEQKKFQNYEDYLRSLNMEAVITPFLEYQYERIAQLVQKSNQFNLTTCRYTLEEIKQMAKDDEYITSAGRLKDKFGDNGIVSLMIAQIIENEAHIRLWVMSCRVLKRDFEFAMFDALCDECYKRGIDKLIGYYYPTPKNSMVKDLYALMGFEEMEDSKWCYCIDQNKEEHKNNIIQILQES